MDIYIILIIIIKKKNNGMWLDVQCLVFVISNLI